MAFQRSTESEMLRADNHDEGFIRSSFSPNENEELRIEHQRLVEKHEKLLTRIDDLEKKRSDLQEQLKGMDKIVAQANETGRADRHMRLEIDRLKDNLRRSEDRCQEIEHALGGQTTTLEDLSRKEAELEREVEKVAALEDQLDEYRHTAEKLQHKERKVAEYKKTLEVSGELRKQHDEFKKQNSQLESEINSYHDQLSKQLAFKTLEDSYRPQIANLKGINDKQQAEIARMKDEIDSLKNEIQDLESTRQHNLEVIQDLEEQLQEAQHGVVSMGENYMEHHEDDMDLDLDQGGSLEDSLKESNATELKMTNRRLERQLKSLQEQARSGRNQQEIVLQHLLDDANRQKSNYEKQYMETCAERDILQSDMAHIRKGIPDAMVDESQHIMSLRLYIKDLEKEAKSLKDEERRLKARLTEGRLGLDPDLNKHKEMEQHVRHLEEKAQEQLKTINKLLLEKNNLQNQRMEQKDLLLEQERLNSEMKASLAALEAKEGEPLKQHSAYLQQKAILQQEQVQVLEAKLKKATDFLKQQDKMLKESNPSHDGHYDEAIVSLKEELTLRDEENEKLKRQIHETRLQARREQQLIISAWYDVARKTHKRLSTSKVYPNAWLGQQRRTLDNQLKRR